MGYIFDDWKKILDTYQECVEKELEEIHQQKAEVQQIKADIFNRLDSGLYYHSNERIVISAPEIVIGNVDKSGDLSGGMGRVVIKGSDIKLEGVGESGSITSRAPSIRQVAVNPGTDGMENVVCDTSEIVSQACNIVMHSSDSKDVFSQKAESAGRGGIWIHADQDLNIEAALTNDKRKETIEAQVSILTEQATNLKNQLKACKDDVDTVFKQMNALLTIEDEKNGAKDYALHVNMVDLDELHQQMDETLPSLYQSTMMFIRTVSQLAEVNRKKKALEEEKKALKSTDDFKQKTTGAQMNISAEKIIMATNDGDGNIHTNDEAGIVINTPRMNMNMTDENGKLVEKGGLGITAQNVTISTLNPSDDNMELTATGSVNIQSKDISFEAMDLKRSDVSIQEKQLTDDGIISMTAKTIEVSTANPQNVERDKDGKLTKGDFVGTGDVIIKSKTVTLESLDYEVADGNLKTKALTKDSKLSVRTEETDILSADAEGKATGSFSVNAKAVSVKSMDVDKEKLTDSALAAGSTMTLVSEKMYVGSKSKDIKSKKIQAQTEELGLFADKTLEAQQGEAKAVLQLADGNAALSGSKTQVYGDTTINAKTEVKGELKAPKLSGDSIEAKSAFKSPNISDGMAAGGGGGGGSLSAKLKTEDAPKE